MKISNPLLIFSVGALSAIFGEFTLDIIKILGLSLIAVSLFLLLKEIGITEKENIEGNILLILPITSGLVAPIFAYGAFSLGNAFGISKELWSITYGPLAEEFLKPLFILIFFAMNTKILDSWQQAFGWGAIAGVVFSGLELISKITVFSDRIPVLEIVLRRAPTFGLHGFETGLMVLGAYFAFKKENWVYVPIVFLLWSSAILMHITWNYY